MTILKWDPFRNVVALQERINRMFDDAFTLSGHPGSEVSMCDWSPLVDIHESREGLFITADLPGVRKEDVSVEIKDNMLTLRGRREKDDTIADDQYLRRERCAGSFHRAFNLQFVIRPDAIRAGFKNGVLEIFIPKPEEAITRQIKVNID
ncbi:MAG: Hsp20/alpha crystallin family protein [Pseudomonadota bacterium]